MIEHLYEDLSVHLYEGEPITKKAPTPPPITYLTQWKIVGNSEVHTDPYLTSWKVSGNSVVDDNTILSCGDLGQDGKYHVKISNGVTVYDIPLDAPLRKVNDVTDTIEFPSSVEGKALVTRVCMNIDLGTCTYGSVSNGYYSDKIKDVVKKPASGTSGIVLCAIYASNNITWKAGCIGVTSTGSIWIGDTSYPSASAIKTALSGVEMIYEFDTPITKLVDVSPFAVSPTDTYTSANVVPFSAFEHTENKEIWSCGEYNATDGKYHILVQPQGGSIADIALTEPLRKVNDVADTIEFQSEQDGKALVTRNIKKRVINPDQIVEFSFGAYRLAVISDALSGDDDTIRTLNNLYDDVSEENRGVSNVAPPRIYMQSNSVLIRGTEVQQQGGDVSTYKQELTDLYANGGTFDVLYALATPTTELVDAPQIQEADSYSCVISPGGKAVSWSSFETNE